MRFLLLLFLMLFSLPAMAADDREVFLSVSSNKPLEKDHLARLTFTLRKGDGMPVTIRDLKTVHTMRMHVLAADPALEDYQHLHPAAAPQKGDFVTGFRPKTNRPYRFWVEVTLNDGSSHRLMATLPGEDKAVASIVKRTLTEQEVDGYRFVLSFDPARPRLGEAAMGRITVSDARGKPVSRLQPILGAYAHIVGIVDDVRTLTHIHPIGAEPASPRDRGGPGVAFHLEPKKPGFLKLFAQFRIDGKTLLVPFGVWVGE